MTDERLKQLMEQVGMPNSISLYGALQQAENEGFQAGAASRDAEIAEFVAALEHILAGSLSLPRFAEAEAIAVIAKVRKP